MSACQRAEVLIAEDACEVADGHGVQTRAHRTWLGFGLGLELGLGLGLGLAPNPAQRKGSGLGLWHRTLQREGDDLELQRGQ